MTENKTGAAQNKLGELFIDFGSTGLGKLIKNLNSVSATFLLTKTAAEQAIKPIINMSKQSIKGAIDISKLSSSLGSTLVETQKLINYLKQNNLSENLLGDLTGLSKYLTDVHQKIKGVDGEMANAFHILGLDWEDYNGDLNSILRLVKDVEKATKSMDSNIARSYINKIGFSDEWLYAFQRNGFNLSDAFLISDEAIQSQLDAAEAINKAKLARDALISETVGKGTANISAPIFSEAASTIEGLRKNDPKAKIKAIKTGSATTSGAGIGAAAGSFFGPIGIGIGAILGGILGGGTQMYMDGSKNEPLKQSPKEMLNFQFAKPLQPPQNSDIMPSNLLPSLPHNLNQTSYIEINNQNYISGNDATEIANKIAAIDIESLQRSQYQAHNLPGV